MSPTSLAPVLPRTLSVVSISSANLSALLLLLCCVRGVLSQSDREMSCRMGHLAVVLAARGANIDHLPTEDRIITWSCRRRSPSDRLRRTHNQPQRSRNTRNGHKVAPALPSVAFGRRQLATSDVGVERTNATPYSPTKLRHRMYGCTLSSFALPINSLKRRI